MSTGMKEVGGKVGKITFPVTTYCPLRINHTLTEHFSITFKFLPFFSQSLAEKGSW